MGRSLSDKQELCEGPTRPPPPIQRLCPLPAIWSRSARWTRMMTWWMMLLTMVWHTFEVLGSTLRWGPWRLYCGTQGRMCFHHRKLNKMDNYKVIYTHRRMGRCLEITFASNNLSKSNMEMSMIGWEATWDLENCLKIETVLVNIEGWLHMPVAAFDATVNSTVPHVHAHKSDVLPRPWSHPFTRLQGRRVPSIRK